MSLQFLTAVASEQDGMFPANLSWTVLDISIKNTAGYLTADAALANIKPSGLITIPMKNGRCAFPLRTKTMRFICAASNSLHQTASLSRHSQYVVKNKEMRLTAHQSEGQKFHIADFSVEKTEHRE